MSGHRRPGARRFAQGPFAAELETLRVPAWVVDTAGGTIVAANAAGRQRFGMAADAPLATLDGAMPGLAKLRALASANGHGQTGRHRETLVFWTTHGVETFNCDIEMAGANDGAPLMLVSVASEEQPVTQPSEVSDDPVSSPPAPRDDAETLKEIARVILSGNYLNTLTVPESGETPQATPLVPASTEINSSLAISAPDLGRLAHELKTPLSAIVSASEVIRDERLGALGNDRYRGYVGDIHDSAKHALAVITRMLNSATGGTSLVPAVPVTPVDLNVIAGRSVSALRAMAEERGLALYDDLEPHLPRVVGDETALRQIVLNLMTNAMKFTAWGGEIHIVTRYARDGSVWLAVRDTGHGMTEDEVGAALDDSVGPEPQWRQGGGLGMGLPLVRQLAEGNGARLEIDSVPGRGTAVVLTFPRDRLAAV